MVKRACDLYIEIEGVGLGIQNLGETPRSPPQSQLRICILFAFVLGLRVLKLGFGVLGVGSRIFQFLLEGCAC